MSTSSSVLLLLLALTASVAYAEDCGTITLTGTDASEFATCTSATSISAVDNPNLVSAEFPLLTFIQDTIVFWKTPALAKISFPLLSTYLYNGGVYVVNTAVTTISFPQLTGVWYLDVWENNALTSIDLPLVAFSENEVEVRNNTALALLNLPVMAQTSIYDGKSLYVKDNNAELTVNLCGFVSAPAPIVLEGVDGAPLKLLESCSQTLMGNFNAQCAPCQSASLTSARPAKASQAAFGKLASLVRARAAAQRAPQQSRP